jgi:mono/diheme cytochrome c family protein
MKKTLIFIVLLPVLFLSATLRAQNSGEEIFESACSSCHTINEGILIGPDLSGIYQIRNNEWLIRFIRSSQQFIKSGDTAAVAIYEKFNKIPMPDNRLTDEQILNIIDYIRVSDQNRQAAATKPVIPDDSLSVKDTLFAVADDSLAIKYSSVYVPEGRALFYGYTSFTNGAAPCIYCHNIKDQSFMGGGRLALDLTGSYLKLGPAGITAMIKNPPFPAMKAAMINNDIKEHEIQAMISLLKSAGEQKYYSEIPDSAGLIFFCFGLVCALILLVHIYIFYDRRKIP